MGIERRKNTRVPFQTFADVSFPGKSYSHCETENLSVKGICVIGVTGHAEGEKCDVSLALSGSTSELRLDMKGEVVRLEPDRTALHFIEIDLDSFYHLKNIIFYNAEDPDKVDKEMTDS